LFNNLIGRELFPIAYYKTVGGSRFNFKIN